jgi:hypothetical protein
MIAKELNAFRLSDEIQNLIQINNDVTALSEKCEENYLPCLELWGKIFKKLNPKKKVLDIPLSMHENDRNTKIVLHQFGFLILRVGRGHVRATQIDENELFKFLKFNKPETFDEIAEEINYKHIRIAFREYCKTINKFLNENDIDEISSMRNFEDKRVCKKEVMFEDGETKKLTSIIISLDANDGLKIILDKVSSGIMSDKVSLSSIEDTSNLIILQQIMTEVTAGAKEILKQMKNDKSNRAVVLLEKLNEKFADFIVAEQL